MEDLDLRLVRYFIVIAEHQHIGRAAAELRVAQPSLSRQIQRLEEQLGVRLFDRDARGSRLTPAGRVFLASARELIESAGQALTKVRSAAASGTLTVGCIPGFAVTPAVRDLQERHPGAEIHTYDLTCEDGRALAERKVDVVVAWQPLAFPMEGQITVLYDDPRVLVVPASHRLAGRASVELADFADEQLAEFAVPGISPEWLAFWWPERPEGGRFQAGPAVHTAQEKVELVAGGRGVAMLTRSDRHSAGRSDLVSIPIVGLPPCQAVVVTRQEEDNSLVQEFRKSALACLPDAATG